MLVPLSTADWQVLRAGAGKQFPLGRELRLSPTRGTKDGSFLDHLVGEGLLERVGKAEAATARTSEPEQFRFRYRLTGKGRHAAEYGEYDRPHAPAERPPVGPAAAVLGARGAVQPRARASSPGRRRGGRKS